MTVYLLVFILFTAGKPAVVSEVYKDRFECETKMAHGADIVEKDTGVKGWLIPVPCVALEQPAKT